MNLRIALFIVFICSALNSQDYKFGLFIEPGFNFIKADASNIIGEGAFYFNYGLQADFAKTERYSFSSGFNHRISKFDIKETNDVDGNAITDKYTYKVQHIEVPLTVRLKTNQLGFFVYYGQIGFLPGIMIRARKDVDYESAEDETNLDASKDINFFNVGLSITAGAEMSLDSETSFFAGIHFLNGFTNVVDDDDDEKISVGNLGLKVGIIF